MTEREPLLPDLPPALEDFVRARYPDAVAARRALQAPWPALGFHSAYEERFLWRAGARPNKRRQAFERSLDAGRDSFARDQPFFPAPGTEGRLRSPYPEVSDADFWVFVRAWGSEEAARRELEKPMPVLGGRTSVQVLAGRSHPSLWRRLTGVPDPRQSVLQIHDRILNGVYT